MKKVGEKYKYIIHYNMDGPLNMLLFHKLCSRRISAEFIISQQMTLMMENDLHSHTGPRYCLLSVGTHSVYDPSYLLTESVPQGRGPRSVAC